jgi:hypothetical protein
MTPGTAASIDRDDARRWHGDHARTALAALAPPCHARAPRGAPRAARVVRVARREHAGADVHCQWPRSAGGERANISPSAPWRACFSVAPSQPPLDPESVGPSSPCPPKGSSILTYNAVRVYCNVIVVGGGAQCKYPVPSVPHRKLPCMRRAPTCRTEQDGSRCWSTRRVGLRGGAGRRRREGRHLECVPCNVVFPFLSNKTLAPDLLNLHLFS